MALLPGVSRTFALNIRLLGSGMREAVGIGYLLCRAADTLEDAWPGDAPAIRKRFEMFTAPISGNPGPAGTLAAQATDAGLEGATATLMTSLPRIWRAWHALETTDRDAIAECVTIMSAGMSRYAGRMEERLAGSSVSAGPPPFAYLDDERELLDYCWVVAGCVGVMLTRMFARRARLDEATLARMLDLAPRVGEGLQLTNILLDWPVDMRSGRCHVPASWLAEDGLRPADLVDGNGGRGGSLAARLGNMARAALSSVPDYMAPIPGRHVRYRQFCAWPALWALASLRHASATPGFPHGPVRPRLTRTRLWSVALSSLAAAHTDGATRSLFARVGG